MAKLYLVATPIGNLKDISLRAIETLKMCDIIACEDTRHSMILLNEYGIKAKLIAYHKHNEVASSLGIAQLVKQGKNVALISDAGTPVISDPGNILVNKFIEDNLEYTIIPGANAAVCALALSGFDASAFAFFGFLSEVNKEKKKQLENIKNFSASKILYSSKHNINADLQSLFEVLGNLKVCVVSEISKVHEKTQFYELATAKIANPKGEYVIVINKQEQSVKNYSDEEIIKEVKNLLKQGKTKNEAYKLVAKKIDRQKKYVYNLFENKIV